MSLPAKRPYRVYNALGDLVANVATSDDAAAVAKRHAPARVTYSFTVDVGECERRNQSLTKLAASIMRRANFIRKEVM